jgi:hypothetical protein
MECPYCNHVFALTWSRYLKSPAGVHECPACHKQSQISRGIGQFLLTAIVIWIVIIPFMILFYRWLGRYWSLLGIVPGVLIGLPFDKIIDEKLRGLQPIKHLRPFAVKFALIVALLNFGEDIFEDIAAIHWKINASNYILIVFLILLLFIFFRMNWARWVFSILLLAGLCVEIYLIFHYDFRFSTLWFVKCFLHSLMDVIAVVALFLPSSNKWFKKYSNTNETA